MEVLTPIGGWWVSGGVGDSKEGGQGGIERGEGRGVEKRVSLQQKSRNQKVSRHPVQGTDPHTGGAL